MNTNPVVEKQYLEGIGEIAIIRTLKSKCIRIKIDHSKGIQLLVPANVPLSFAIKFAEKKKSWIHKSLRKSHNIKSRRTLFTEDTVYSTFCHHLCIEKQEKNTIKTIISQDKVLVLYPNHASVADPRIQIAIRKAIEETWKIEAKKILPQRVKELAEHHGFKYGRVSVRNASTRWGSCSAKNDISLNIQLMRLPDILINYIILHELSHTIEKNHKTPFWNLLEQKIPDARQIDKSLNKYHLKYW